MPHNLHSIFGQPPYCLCIFKKIGKDVKHTEKGATLNMAAKVIIMKCGKGSKSS